jgi:hypothetical protein
MHIQVQSTRGARLVPQVGVAEPLQSAHFLLCLLTNNMHKVERTTFVVLINLRNIIPSYEKC